MTTVTGIVQTPQSIATRVLALKQHRDHFPVVLHDLPAARFDGILGLDFLRGQELTIDFRQGLITLS